MLEKEIERKLKSPIKKLGGLCLKFETPGYTGVPDRIILLPGGIVRFVETKAPGKKERKRQILVHGVFRKLGFVVYSTIDTPEKAQWVAQECAEVVHHG